MKTKQERKDEAWEEYVKIRNPAWKEYEKIREPVWEEYMKIRNTALEEYRKKCEQIDNDVKSDEC